MIGTNNSKVFGLSIFILCVSILMNLPHINGANVANIIPYRDEDGKLRRVIDQDVLLRKRDAKRLPLDLEDILDHGSFDKRDTTGSSLSLEELLEEEQQLVKRGQKTFAGDVLTLSLDSKLPNLKEISIFYEYLRNDVILAQRLSDENEDLLVVSPTNEAISRLALKPWQFPSDIENLEKAGASDVEIDNAIEGNVLKFVRSHVVEYDESKSIKNEELGYTILKSVAFQQSGQEGGDILLKKKDDQFYVASIRDEQFHLVEKVETGANGVILIVNSCLVWP